MLYVIISTARTSFK